MFLPGAQVAILLAPVAYVTHMDSLPMNALAALDTDEVRAVRLAVLDWQDGCCLVCEIVQHVDQGCRASCGKRTPSLNSCASYIAWVLMH